MQEPDDDTKLVWVTIEEPTQDDVDEVAAHLESMDTDDYSFMVTSDNIGTMPVEDVLDELQNISE
jgi:hypothetical protein